MDSFFSLFDPSNGNDTAINEDFTLDNNQNALPPEPQLGNVEYKLKIVNPTKQRFEHLVTQVRRIYSNDCLQIYYETTHKILHNR